MYFDLINSRKCFEKPRNDAQRKECSWYFFLIYKPEHKLIVVILTILKQGTKLYFDFSFNKLIIKTSSYNDKIKVLRFLERGLEFKW